MPHREDARRRQMHRHMSDGGEPFQTSAGVTGFIAIRSGPIKVGFKLLQPAAMVTVLAKSLKRTPGSGLSPEGWTRRRRRKGY